MESSNSNTIKNYEFEDLQYANNYRSAILKEFLPYLKGEIIEVGAGIGQFTELLKTINDAKRILTIEPHEPFVKKIKQTLPDIEAIRGTIKSVNLNSQWDAIVCVNVLEHIKDDLDELKYYNQLLENNGGNLCLFVPARKELYSDIDALFGHYRRYNRKELISKLNQSGFNIVKMHYFNFIGYFSWFLIFKMFKTRTFNPTAVKTFDKYILPVMHSWEYNFVRPPFGQSLIAVAKAG